MKIWEIRLQNGIFVYKAGISFTKWDFHLQRETLGLQTGLSLYISPLESLYDALNNILCETSIAIVRTFAYNKDR